MHKCPRCQLDMTSLHKKLPEVTIARHAGLVHTNERDFTFRIFSRVSHIPGTHFQRGVVLAANGHICVLALLVILANSFALVFGSCGREACRTSTLWASAFCAWGGGHADPIVHTTRCT